jgi:hypothetical protein
LYVSYSNKEAGWLTRCMLSPDTISNSVKDVRKAATKVCMLIGTYMLQTLKVKFNQAEVDPTCPICEDKFSVKFPLQSDLSLLDQEDEIAVRTLFFFSILL